MVIAIFGESCTGKSTIADFLKSKLSAEIFSGKDYLRLEKNENDAEKAFKQLLLSKSESNENIIYVISETVHLQLLPEKCYRVLVTASLDIIKERFAKRTGGKLPPPLEKMLENKHGSFDNVPHNLHIESDGSNVESICRKILTDIS